MFLVGVRLEDWTVKLLHLKILKAIFCPIKMGEIKMVQNKSMTTMTRSKLVSLKLTKKNLKDLNLFTPNELRVQSPDVLGCTWSIKVKSCHPVEARPCQCGLLVGDLSTLYFATNFLPLEIRIVDPENWINAKCKSPWCFSRWKKNLKLTEWIDLN